MRRIYALTVLLAAVVFAGPAAAEKTDVVLLVNGNAITGEVKSLDFGALSYKTDSMGTVTIDWEDVVGVTSKQTLQVEVADGTRYFGHLNTSDERFHISVVTLSQTFDLATSQVVRMTPIDTDESFLERLDGSFSLGFTTQKSSEVTTLNVATDMNYRTQRYLVGLQANATYTEQPDQPETERANIGVNYQRFRGNRWYTEWFTSWERNDELGILSRYTAGGGFGRYIVQSNRNEFSLAAGLNASRELYTGDTETSTIAEGRVQIRYLHRSIEPEASATLTTNVYPTLDDFSKYRSETDITFRREIVEDLFLDVTLYQSYTSDPPEGAASSDYGVTTSLGYSW